MALLPEYIYRCTADGKLWSIRHAPSEVKDERHCPECGALMKRKFMPLNITWRHSAAGMEVMTNEADATEQLYQQITIEE